MSSPPIVLPSVSATLRICRKKVDDKKKEKGPKFMFIICLHSFKESGVKNMYCIYWPVHDHRLLQVKPLLFCLIEKRSSIEKTTMDLQPLAEQYIRIALFHKVIQIRTHGGVYFHSVLPLGLRDIHILLQIAKFTQAHHSVDQQKNK